VGVVQTLGGTMQIGDLVELKSNPAALGIVVSLYTDIYNEGSEYHESRWAMAMVQWNISNFLSAFEVTRLEVIG
jgi:hypothetical protein